MYMCISTITFIKCICVCVFMGRMQIVISDKIEQELRRKAADKFGFKKGSISTAIEEAIRQWLKA